jgi:hypothetical protein
MSMRGGRSHSQFHPRTDIDHASGPSAAKNRQGSNMKFYAVAASLAAGLAMLPETASAQVRGTGGVSYGNGEDLGIEGGLTIPTGGSLAFLVDGDWDQGDSDSFNSFDTYSAAGHLITRNSERAWGGFIGVSRADIDFDDIDTWTVGGEYARFLPNYTLAGRLSYSSIDDADVDIWGLSGEYRLFANDNLRFDFGAGWSLIDGGAGDDDAITLAGGAEYRFANSPISLGARMGWVNSDDDDETSVGVTLRFDFGNRSLKDRDRNGNTFGAIGSMISSILP